MGDSPCGIFAAALTLDVPEVCAAANTASGLEETFVQAEPGLADARLPTEPRAPCSSFPEAPVRSKEQFLCHSMHAYGVANEP